MIREIWWEVSNNLPQSNEWIGKWYLKVLIEWFVGEVWIVWDQGWWWLVMNEVGWSLCWEYWRDDWWWGCGELEWIVIRIGDGGVWEVRCGEVMMMYLMRDETDREREAIVIKDRTVWQFDKHLITIKSHTSSWWSVWNSHSYWRRMNHSHKHPHSKCDKKKKGGKEEKYDEWLWLFVGVLFNLRLLMIWRSVRNEGW